MNILTKFAASATVMLLTAFGASAVSHLKIIGSATPGRWEILDGILLKPDPDKENVFSCIAYLKADEEFKFTCANGWDRSKEYLNASDDPYEIGRLVNGGDDKKFKVPENANYHVVCDLNEMTISVKKADYQDNPIRFNALFMVGNATAGGWEITSGTPLVWGGEENPFKFTWSGELKEGEFKINSNIYSGSWAGPWFFAGVDGDNNIDYSIIVADGTGDRKWKIAEAGKYDIEADISRGTMSITKAASSGIEDITEECDEAPVYYNLQGIVVNNPTNGVYIKKSGNKVSKVII